MPFAGTRAEPRLDPVQELGRQRDFGQQHQRLPALTQAFGDGLQIDLGLARAGDPAQKRGAIGAGPHGGAQAQGRLGLIGSKGFAGQIRVQARIGQIARRQRLGQRAGLDQSLHHAGADAGQLRQFTRRKARAAVIVDHPQHGGAGIGHPFGRRAGPMDDPPRRGRLIQIGRPRRHAQHQGHRRQRVFPHPGQEFDHLGRQRRRIDQPRHRSQPRRIEIAQTRPPDRPHHPPRPQGHDDKLAQPHAPLGRKIVKDANHLLRQHRDARAMGIE